MRPPYANYIHITINKKLLNEINGQINGGHTLLITKIKAHSSLIKYENFVNNTFKIHFTFPFG